MKIILVCLNIVPNYLLDNVDFLFKLNNTDITIITDKKNNHVLEHYNIQIVNVENLIENYNNVLESHKNETRDGFWFWTTYRFVVIQKYMKLYNVNNILHIENDVLLFKNVNDINFHDKTKILITMDSTTRCIPGIMYIPNSEILEICINNFHGQSDMYKWGHCYNNLKQYVDNLPIFNDNTLVSNNFNNYNYIFDAAAIGQYLGGIDPRNGNSKPGFVNETCIIKYNKYKFIWKKNKYDVLVPYIIVDNREIEIVNLHVHCKDLKKFILKN